MPETSTKDVVLNEKPADTIVLLNEKGPSYPKKLSDETETTYSHMVRMLKDLKEEDLVTSEKKGRRKVYKLTGKGEKLGEQLSELYDTSLVEGNFRDGDDDAENEKKIRPKLEDSLQKKYG
ncbi:MAG: winged helix DNA-binding protein [Candidatus Nanohalobium sp.]